MQSFGLDWRLIIAQIVNFALFYFIFKRFISKPFLKYLKDQRSAEAEKEKLLLDLKKKEEEMLIKEKKAQAEIKKQINNELTKAKKEAEKLKQDIIDQARKEGNNIVIKAKLQAEEERKKMYKELSKRVVEFSLYLIDKSLKDYLTDDAKKKITNYIITHINTDLSPL